MSGDSHLGTPLGNTETYGTGNVVTERHPRDCPCRTCRRLRRKQAARLTEGKQP
jgi:hypothetical protein